MKRTIYAVLVVVGFCSGAYAQRALTLPKATQINSVRFDRQADGSFTMNVAARTAEALPDGGTGVVLDREVSCDLQGDLTASERTAANTVRAAALRCWNNNASGGAL